ncbi:MATE family efflux transporter [Tissierella sp.]|uniref:MATE family efflux transporter n=1 Tax=Tissierella sp. TaxID=41274 RepID=UPI0028B167FB|nr:MATE family efflux transporter [Tissierella sp.]
MYFRSPWFATWFTQDTEAIGKIVTALRIDAFAQIPLAVSLIFAGALQGSGNTKSSLYSTAIGMWGIRVLGVKMGIDIAGVWISILIDLTIRSVFLTILFRDRTQKDVEFNDI